METEAEGASFEEIKSLVEFGDVRQLPVFVKIGGPDARNDIRQCCSIGINGFIAPMIESPFSVKKFHEATNHAKVDWRGLTIESITAFKNLAAIASAAVDYGIQGLTFGRGDFSDSINLRGSEDSDEVSAYVDEFIATCRDFGLVASVGGNMKRDSLQVLAELPNSPDRLEGRRGIWDFNPKPSVMFEDLKSAIGIELEEVRVNKERLSLASGELDRRALVLQGRLELS